MRDIPTCSSSQRLMQILVFLFALFIANIQAEIPLVDESEIVPAERHERATEIITHIINTYHYKSRPLDDSLSTSILDRYLDSLDPNRSYFLASDISNFDKYRFKLDNRLKDEDLVPAFDIFRIYRNRVDERINHAIAILDNDFDFTIDESYRFDRRDSDWARTKAELDEIWRKRVKNDVLNLLLAKKDDAEYVDTLAKRYERIRTNTFQLDSNDIFQTFINSYTTSIEPHTAYFSPRESENFDISMRLSLEGIGAVLTTENDYTVIQNIIPGGPADLSNQLHDEDKIIGVGQGKNGEIVDIIGWRLDDVVDLIRGPKGTTLRIEILPKNSGPEGPHKMIMLVRNKIKLEEQAAKSSIIEITESKRKIGVINLPTFYIDFTAQARGDKNYKSTSGDVRKLIAKLKEANISGLIIDLRGNGGGSLSEALELTGLFIEKGPIVQTKDSTGRIDINDDPDPSIVYSGPMAVLVDRNSASASEIFAGAIQDYQRGIIIGEPTFGKGTVQNIVDLDRFISNADEEHGRLKTTIAQFFRVSGGSNQHRGVIPDIILPTANISSDYGEKSLDNALPWDQVKPAKYIKVMSTPNDISMAETRHKQRIKSDRAFQLMLEEQELIEETSNQKEISLLMSEREAEREKLQKTRQQLENEIRIAQGLPPLNDNESNNEGADQEDDTMDIILKEAGMILDDMISPSYDLPMDIQAVQNSKNKSDPL
ncbi:MAG: tail-specific protease [Gammaproteobacteria bacterium]|nr:tail-specific protease [Gammaproteobacteria bacterium]NIN62647.1 tail-specific protease [Gammaproteobacteria bacterium]NIO63185.1 tail-specific protease [Gammaproteobacteria bacterium]NIQ11318.1 tail-specific protease [Gammaproteobacteria bacterium]NIQ20285.1 tail-specific protease [Gammaproteobacteria bacterium]